MNKSNEDKAKEYGNSHFESCKYPYADDKRITDIDKLIAAHLAGASSHTNRWVKASERLPIYKYPEREVRQPKGHDYAIVVEWNNPNEYCVKTSLGVKEVCDFEKDGTWNGDLREGEIVLEWLDEAESPSLSELEEKKAYPYNLCPKCNGKGWVMNPYATTTNVTELCDVCNGAKIIAPYVPELEELRFEISQLKKQLEFETNIKEQWKVQIDELRGENALLNKTVDNLHHAMTNAEQRGAAKATEQLLPELKKQQERIKELEESLKIALNADF